ncbi:hypothetical protein HN362_02955 [bacterium]|nr:hypothetical protein [bacterium]MBT3582052.1 hypothetical protein [bacterium]
MLITLNKKIAALRPEFLTSLDTFITDLRTKIDSQYRNGYYLKPESARIAAKDELQKLQTNLLQVPWKQEFLLTHYEPQELTDQLTLLIKTDSRSLPDHLRALVKKTKDFGFPKLKQLLQSTLYNTKQNLDLRLILLSVWQQPDEIRYIAGKNWVYDQSTKLFLLKKTGAPIAAAAECFGSQLAAFLTNELVPKAHPADSTYTCIQQEYWPHYPLPVTPLKNQWGSITGLDFQKVSPEQHLQLVQHMATDQLMANYDTHEGNFGLLPDGRIISFDKVHALRMLVHESLFLMNEDGDYCLEGPITEGIPMFNPEVYWVPIPPDQPVYPNYRQYLKANPFLATWLLEQPSTQAYWERLASITPEVLSDCGLDTYVAYAKYRQNMTDILMQRCRQMRASVDDFWGRHFARLALTYPPIKGIDFSLQDTALIAIDENDLEAGREAIVDYTGEEEDPSKNYRRINANLRAGGFDNSAILLTGYINLLPSVQGEVYRVAYFERPATIYQPGELIREQAFMSTCTTVLSDFGETIETGPIPNTLMIITTESGKRLPDLTRGESDEVLIRPHTDFEVIKVIPKGHAEYTGILAGLKEAETWSNIVVLKEQHLTKST